VKQVTQNKRVDIEIYKELGLPNVAKVQIFQTEGLGTLRSDVLYKTIIRDMRKFLIKDFNVNTSFISHKRHRGDEFYIQCLQEYVGACNPDFKKFALDNPLDPSFNFSADSHDLVFFMGCMLYPKHLEHAFESLKPKDPAM
jgi:hypothetical protein